MKRDSISKVRAKLIQQWYRSCSAPSAVRRGSPPLPNTLLGPEPPVLSPEVRINIKKSFTISKTNFSTLDIQSTGFLVLISSAIPFFWALNQKSHRQSSFILKAHIPCFPLTGRLRCPGLRGLLPNPRTPHPKSVHPPSPAPVRPNPKPSEGRP
jgi:hypothetical protein